MILRFSAAYFLAAFGWAAAATPTFSKDVAPILYSRCVECHRSGEAAPMAFASYAEVRPWAKAIRQAVLTRTMPPWLADPHFGSFRNDRRLPEEAIRTIADWADAGAPEGNPKEMPQLPRFETGWRIGKPDAVFDIGTDFDVPPEALSPTSTSRFPLTSQKTGGWRPRRSGRASAAQSITYSLSSGSRLTNQTGQPMRAIFWWATLRVKTRWN